MKLVEVTKVEFFYCESWRLWFIGSFMSHLKQIYEPKKLHSLAV
jgi:hypothetical protein